MSRRKSEAVQIDSVGLPTATTPEGRENQVIAMAYDLAEKQIREGTASAQVITHFLKMGSQKERMEREVLAEQRKLLTAKTGAMESSKNMEKMYEDVINAMKRYSGSGGVDEEY